MHTHTNCFPAEREWPGGRYTPIVSIVDPRGCHLVDRDDPNWAWRIGLLKGPMEAGLAGRLFLYEMEYAAYAFMIYAQGSVSWEDFLQAKADVEYASFLLHISYRLTSWSKEGEEYALEEMRASDHLWLPILAECISNEQDYTLLAYHFWLFVHRNQKGLA